MNQIIVKSQEEFNNIPADYEGRIIIEFGTPRNRAVIDRRFRYSVVARENSSVEALENSSVEALENSSVEALENSSVVAFGNSSVVAFGNSSVVAFGNSSIVAFGNSSIVARENSSVEASGNSSVVARENSSIVAFGNSSIVARENSSVEALENSSVVALENSSVVAWGNSQIISRQYNGKININGNARIVYDPNTIDEYIEIKGDIECTRTTVKLFKAVHKHDGQYFSDRNNDFKYVVGEIAEADGLTKNPNEECGHGIHMADKSWCVAYGQNWPDLAILELEVEKDGVVIPKYGVGKVRAKRAKVLREVPLEECGLLGKIVSKNRK